MAGSEGQVYWPQKPDKRAAQQQCVAREMQVLIVLLANCGARVGDWVDFEFGRQIDLSTREAYWKSNKRDKVHRVPLAAVTMDHLARLRRWHAQLPGMEDAAPSYLFPNLRSQRAKNRATKLLKLAIAAIGLDVSDYPKPWHSIRRSCTTRFNAHGISMGLGSVGKLITHGKDADVASQSYDNPLPTIAKAVETISWPAEFFG